jgi:hypothetical protein
MTGDPNNVLAPIPLNVGGQQPTGLFGVVTALLSLTKAANAVVTALGNSYISVSANNIFTGTNTFNGAVTAAAGLTSSGLTDLGGGQQVAVRTVTAAGAVTVAFTDYLVAINKTVGAATTVNLPAAPPAGTTFRVKDGKGDANTNNITVVPAAGTIDGAANIVINTAYGHATIGYDGTTWYTI